MFRQLEPGLRAKGQHSAASRHIHRLHMDESKAKRALPIVKAKGWGVETSIARTRSPASADGRVACAHVQPATVKAHAPVLAIRFPTSGFGRRSERYIGAIRG